MDVFKIEKEILKLCGIERYPSKQKKHVRDALMIWHHAVMIYGIFASISYILSANDILGIAESVSAGGTVLFMLIKFSVFCGRSDELFGFMDEIEQLNEKYTDLPNSKEILSNANKLLTKIMTPIKFGCIVTPIFYILKPLSSDVFNYLIYDIQPSCKTLLKVKYFYNVTQSPTYELTYLFETYETCLSCFLIYATSSIFSNFCLNINAHFEILRNSINNMKIDEFVKYHVEILEITYKLNSFYRPLILAQYSIGIVLFAVLGLSVVAADNWLQNLIPIFHTYGALIYVAVFSYVSQKIMDSSEALCDEAYNIDKDYLMVIMIAQKKLRFTTGFFEVSFDTYSIMLSRSWSFIALLNSFPYRGVPLKARFIYDETKSPAYELTFLLQVYATVTVSGIIES
ncbi:odorant receptor 82a-like [Chironomus tepperi]|uniref:odorant receptor 82a-like n=1 Tax=Chironomus tepperi TaxID=113505 RepID=UPI00391F3283